MIFEVLDENVYHISGKWLYVEKHEDTFLAVLADFNKRNRIELLRISHDLMLDWLSKNHPEGHDVVWIGDGLHSKYKDDFGGRPYSLELPVYYQMVSSISDQLKYDRIIK